MFGTRTIVAVLPRTLRQVTGTGARGVSSKNVNWMWPDGFSPLGPLVALTFITVKGPACAGPPVKITESCAAGACAFEMAGSAKANPTAAATSSTFRLTHAPLRSPLRGLPLDGRRVKANAKRRSRPQSVFCAPHRERGTPTRATGPVKPGRARNLRRAARSVSAVGPSKNLTCGALSDESRAARRRRRAGGTAAGRRRSECGAGPDGRRRCAVCGTLEGVEAHYRVPLVQGGSDLPANRVALCRAHHRTAERAAS